MGLPGIPSGNSHRVRAGDPTPVCPAVAYPPPRDDALGERQRGSIRWQFGL